MASPTINSRLPKLVRRVIRWMKDTSNESSKPQHGAFLVTAVHGEGKTIITQNRHQNQNHNHRFGEDSWFTSSTPKAEVLGVADGVGSWRALGIDAGHFAHALMQCCEENTHHEQFNPCKLLHLLSHSYGELKESSHPVAGSSTACLAALDRNDCSLYTANIGDSGIIVVRDGQVIYRTMEQLHGFNTPFQLALSPDDWFLNTVGDPPETAICERVALRPGDILLLATDGLFDNVPEKLLLGQLRALKGVTERQELQKSASVLVALARDLSQSAHYLSPFAKKARDIHQVPYTIGGKPDDITVIIATVNEY